jgi:hypothetical protein
MFNLSATSGSGTTDLTADVTGVLPQANGGTGSATGTWTFSGAWAVTAATTVTLTATGGLFTIATGGNNNIVLSPGGTGVVTTAKKVTITEGSASVGFTGPAALTVTGGIAASDTCFLANVVVTATGIFQFNGQATLYSPAANKVRITNPAFSSASTMLLFSLETSAAVALKRNGAVLETKLADDSAYAPHKVSYLQAVPVAVGSLPAAATAGSGARHVVTDALTPTFGATVVAGGAVTVPVYSDGSAWKVG